MDTDTTDPVIDGRTASLDTDEKGRFVRNDESTARMLHMLATAGLHLCDGEIDEARFLYRSVLESAYKADQGTRKKKGA